MQPKMHKEKVMEFSSELEGKRVGWVSVRELAGREDSEKMWGVDVVSATVGGEGSELYREVLAVGDDIRRYPRQMGFLAISGMSATLIRGRNTPDSFKSYTDCDNARGSGDGGAALLDNGISHKAQNLSDDEKKWAVGPEGIVSLIKAGMASFDIADQYPQVYYYLNGTIGVMGRQGFNGQGSVDGLALRDLLLPDKEMIDKTREQILCANLIRNTLEHSLVEDDLMKRDLTVFSEKPASAILETFSESRGYAAELEANIADLSLKMAIGQLACLPIGFRPDGRSWPYIDASAPDGIGPFNPSRHLAGEDIWPLARELEREESELAKRIEYASNGLSRLSALASAEESLK